MVVIPGRGVALAPMMLALFGAACGTKAPPPPRPSAAPVAAAFTVESLTVSLPLSFPAQLYVEHDAAVAARSAGVIDSLLVDIGTTASPGQLLARIESIDQDIALARAEAALEQSERALTRARGLSQVRGMTVADSEQVEFEHREAALGVREARRAVELTRITAPFGGVVTARYVRPRRLVSAGDTLFRIAERGPLLARVRVPESAATSIRVGARARVEATGAGAGAVVFRVAPVIDPGSGTKEVILRLDGPSRLLSGAAVTIRLGAERRQVLAVPQEAIGPDGYVVVVDGDRTTLRAVVPGIDLGRGRREILSGLRAGERLARPGR